MGHLDHPRGHPEYRTHPLLARRPHVARWRRHLEETPSQRTGRPLSAATVARKLSALAEVYRYAIAPRGVPLQDVQDALGHADPRTTRRYDRGRHNLDRSPAYKLAEVLRRT